MAKLFLVLFLVGSVPLFTAALTSIASVGAFFRLPDHKGLKWSIGGGYALAVAAYTYSQDMFWVGALAWAIDIWVAWVLVGEFKMEIRDGNNALLKLLLFFRLVVEQKVFDPGFWRRNSTHKQDCR